MNYLRLPNMDEPVSVFAICIAHAQLEADYNQGGILWERPSNQRRNESTGVQLSRMGFSAPFTHVEILSDESNDIDDEDVRDIYLINVLKLGLPMDDEMKEFIKNRYTQDFLQQFNFQFTTKE